MADPLTIGLLGLGAFSAGSSYLSSRSAERRRRSAERRAKIEREKARQKALLDKYDSMKSEASLSGYESKRMRRKKKNNFDTSYVDNNKTAGFQQDAQDMSTFGTF